MYLDEGLGKFLHEESTERMAEKGEGRETQRVDQGDQGGLVARNLEVEGW